MNTASCFGRPGVFNRQRYGHKSLLSDKRKIKTLCHSETVDSVKRLLLHTHSGMLSHTYQWPRTSSSLLIFFLVLSVECTDARPCMWTSGCACAYIHICWPWEVCVHSCSFRILCVCVSLLHQFSTNEAGDSVGLSDGTECQQAYRLPPGSAWQHGGKDTGERNKGGRQEGTMDGERKGLMLPLKAAGNRVRPVWASEGHYQ